MSDPLQASRRTTAFRGAILTVAMRWTDRLLGVLNTLILARLLVPADFGLVAMAMVFAGLVDVILDLGVAAALVQNTRAGAEHFHTAWTLRILQSTGAAVALVASAPFVAQYYGDSRVMTILWVVALSVFVGGLENIGTVSFQKNLEFGRDFQYFFLRRVVGVAFAIGAALTLRSYWALVLGSLVSRIAGVGISYWMSGFRPKLSLAQFSDIWSFSQWNMVASVGHYLNTALSRLVIGRRADASVLGAYSMGEEIALMPTTELLAPLGRVMFPVFAEAREDASKLLRVVRLALAVQAIVAIPAGVGVALVARDAIAVLLGAKWSAAAIYTQIIALASIAAALGHSSTYMLTATGHIRGVVLYSWSKVLIFLALVVTVVPSADARGVAMVYLATAYIGLVVLLVLARQVVPQFTWQHLWLETWRPLLATVIMAATVLVCARFMESFGTTSRLATEILIGAGTYTLCILMLWRLAGSPAGAETYAIDKLSPYWRARPTMDP